jgi:hypothetical protein
MRTPHRAATRHKHSAAQRGVGRGLALLLALAALCVLPAAASAAEPPSRLWQVPEDGQRGTGAGRFGVPSGVVADPDTGFIYVADSGNARISEFTSWGVFVKAFGWGVKDGASELQSCTAQTGCLKGLLGTGAGQFVNPTGLALDASGDLYVGEPLPCTFGCPSQSSRVQKFDPSAGLDHTQAEFILMFGGEVNKTNHSNVCTAASGDTCGLGTIGAAPGQFDDLACVSCIGIGPTGTVYVGDSNRIQVFKPDGEFKAELGLPTPGEVAYLSVDQATGEVYFDLFQPDGVEHSLTPFVYRLSPEGEALGKLAVETPGALALDLAGNAFVVEGESFDHPYEQVLEFNQKGTLVSQFGETDSHTSIFSQIHIPGLGVGAMHAGSKVPGDVYLSSSNPEQTAVVTAYGPAPEFELPPKVPPQIVDQYAATVDPEGALLRAKINPHFWKDTTYFVEYGLGKCSAGGCTSVQPAAPGLKLTSQLANFPLLSTGIVLTGLASDTTYHYRVVAASGGSDGQPVRGVGGEVGSDGQEASFTTPAPSPPPPNPDLCGNSQFRVGTAALLPDCRAYEMVSPVGKNNGDVLALLNPIGFPARLDQSAISGEALTYSSFRAFAGSPSGGWMSQFLADRGVSGWTTSALSPPQSGVQIRSDDQYDTPYKAFSADLRVGWLRYAYEQPLDPGVPGGFINLFRRETATSGYEGLLRAVPPPSPSPFGAQPELQGVSADGSGAVFRAQDNLTPDAPELAGGANSPHQLYESFAEEGGPRQLRLVSILPSKMPAKAGASAGLSNGGGGRTDNVAHAMSEDGSRIYWTAADTGPGKIYLRLNGEKTLAVSETVTTQPARFWSAAADGSKALFSLTAGVGKGDLYEYDLATKASTLVAHKSLGVLGASEDLLRVYFLSEEVLAQGAAAGKPNLYFDDEGTVTYVGQLSAQDAEGASELSKDRFSPVSLQSVWHAARVSPSGLSLGFMSYSHELSESVAGYDNTDQANGTADAEVYHYAAVTNTLSCVSCNPTGAAPVGRELALGAYNTGVWGAARIPTSENELYQPRFLSADGSRLFFDSFESLLPRDVNGAEDVYEWEEPGNGSCTEASPAFSVPSGGCLSLISSGESPRDSELIDAGPTGRDVFFSTLSSLVPQDPGLVDIYDARELGGFPNPPSPPAVCEGEACQGPHASPNDLTPASATFDGAGNVREGPAVRCAKGKVRHKSRCISRRKKAKAKTAAHRPPTSIRRAGR